MVTVPEWFPIWQLGLITMVAVSLGIVRVLDTHYDWGGARRSRLLLGIPWGTLVSLTAVLCVYLFVQDAWTNWHRPLTIPFRSWSYFYPTGMLTAAFAHNSAGHITSNLLSAIVFGTLAEYAWGHYPDERGTHTFSSLWTNPYARAFFFFPSGVFIVGLLTAIFGWGPLIGFSGVVFAFAGFALLRYPILTVIMLEARRVVRTIYNALSDPVVVAQAEPQFVTPWWAGTAVQGHFLGLFLGIALAAVIFRRKDINPTRLWVASFLVTMSLSIWAIWWFRGGSEYVLHQGLGVLLVLGIALVITLGAWTSKQDWAVHDIPIHKIGILLLVFPILVVGFAAVPLNLTTVADATPPGGEDPIEIEDYVITYAENVTDQHVSIVDVELFGETTQVQRSGVIVISEDRHAWSVAVSKSRLEFAGLAQVRVGGIGWHDHVSVRRAGWEAENNETAYAVWLRPAAGDWQQSFRSNPVVAEPVIDGYRVWIVPAEDGFFLEVRENETVVDRVEIPGEDSAVETSSLEFIREDDSMYAISGATEVRIATRETYN